MRGLALFVLAVVLFSVCCTAIDKPKVAPNIKPALAPAGIITYNGLAVTAHGQGQQLTLEPINVCDPNQLFEYTADGTIVLQSNRNLVIDVADEVPNNGARVILWNKKSPPDNLNNQLWNVYSAPAHIESRMATGFNLQKSSTTNGVVMSYLNPAQTYQFAANPYPCPVTCQSAGDPHFVCWGGKRFDFQSANTVLLAQFNNHRVYAVQYACNRGVTCNQGIVVMPAGTTESFQLTWSQGYHNGAAVVLPLGTTTYSANLSIQRYSATYFRINLPGGYVDYINYGIHATVITTITSGTPQLSICHCPPVVGHAKRFPPDHDYGNQFLVKNKNETQYNYVDTPFVYDPNYVPNYGPYNSTDAALVADAKALCSVLQTGSLVTSCAPYVDTDGFYDTCYGDVIATGIRDFSQPTIDSFARLCYDEAALAGNASAVVLPTSPAQSTATGAGLNATIARSNTAITFTIQAKDALFRNRATGGEAFTVTSTPTRVYSIVDNRSGTYTVSYVPSTAGTYTISIKLGQSSVGGSPFNVTVVEPDDGVTVAAQSIAYGPGLLPSNVPSGVLVNFTIQARTAAGTNRTTGGDEFGVAFVGGVFIFDSLKDNGDGTYIVKYVAYATGSYQVKITYKNVDIKGSPYPVGII